jgi:glycosyltransferase involved in cell wall biosynthesis
MLHNRYLLRGGEDESTDMEVELLQKNGHDVHLLEIDNRDINQSNILRTSVDTVWSSYSFRTLVSKLKEEPCDIVHIQNFFPRFSPAVHHAAKSAGKPVVQSLRNYRLFCLNGLFFRDGFICEDCMDHTLPWPGIVHKCYRNSLPGSMVVAGMLTTHRMLKTWQKKVDLFCTLSEFSRDKFIQGGLPPEKIMVKPNFVYPDPEIGEEHRDFFLVVSRLVEEKGILLILKTWEQLGIKIPLKIVGDGPLMNIIKDATRKTPWIDVCGKKSLPEVYNLIGQARAVLFPSLWYETFGRVIIEAYAKGTPVIVSNIGAGSYLVGDSQAGILFRSGDSGDLVQKVQWAWDHPNEMAEMGRNARHEYEVRYTADKNYDMLMDIYQRAIELNQEGTN